MKLRLIWLTQAEIEVLRFEFRCTHHRPRPNALNAGSLTQVVTVTLAFAALLMAGIDGIQNKIDPGDPLDKDIYALTPEELKDVRPHLAPWVRLWRHSVRINIPIEGAMYSPRTSSTPGLITKWKTRLIILTYAPYPASFELYFDC